MRGYHGVGLDGNDANRFMSLLDVLEKDVTITAAINILPIINCLHKFSLVKFTQTINYKQCLVWNLEQIFLLKLKTSKVHFLVFNCIPRYF